MHRPFVLMWQLVLWQILASAHAQVVRDPGAVQADAFAIQPGEFPPPGTSHYIGGELIDVDDPNRSGTLRPDRTDDQNRAYIDRPLPFALLPFGAVWYRGAPAALRDIPLGTHLHGEFYVDRERAADPQLRNMVEPRRTLHPYFAYYRVLRLEDDFSRALRTGRLWRIDAVNLDALTLTVTATGPQGEDPAAAPLVFELHGSTRVWQGRMICELSDLLPGQIVVANLTACTIRGPGRVADLWLDAQSRALATGHQLEVHRLYLRSHGFSGWIDAVDNQAGLVTVTLFDTFDPAVDLASTFTATATGMAPLVSAVVANDAWRSYDQQNIKKSGPLVSTSRVPRVPGCSGFQMTFRPADLLEGFRPQRIVRMYPEGWKVEALFREEELKR